jgi:hypothetical protein
LASVTLRDVSATPIAGTSAVATSARKGSTGTIVSALQHAISTLRRQRPSDHSGAAVVHVVTRTSRRRASHPLRARPPSASAASSNDSAATSDSTLVPKPARR